MNWLALLGWDSRPASKAKKSTRTRRLEVEDLEGRLVPSGTPALDLSTTGSFGGINGAIFAQDDTQPAGSGAIDSFVRLQSKHGGDGVAQGYNTDARPVQFDEKTSPVFTRSLPLSEIPLINAGGTMYREFMLDVNQTNSTPLLSLDELRIYTASAGNLTGYDPSSLQLAGNSPIYDMGAGNWIQLNSGLNPGSGIANMVALIPDSLFTGNYVYLYSKFGVNLPTHGGYEEWAVQGNGNGSGSSPNCCLSGGSISGNVSQLVNGVTSTQAGWVVFIDTNGDGKLDNNEDYVLTDANGNFTFPNLATSLGAYSTYTIMVQPPSLDWTSAVTAYTVSLQNCSQAATNVNFVETFAPINVAPNT
jgi:hypothetical protein